MIDRDMQTGTPQSEQIEGRIGIVVIGRNEGERLQACLTSLNHQGEVIYADSASLDCSVEMAEKLGFQVIELTQDVPLTAARGRNAGANALLAQKELDYIQFIDGDCELDPEWLRSAVRFMDNNTSIAAVCGRRSELHPERSIYNRLCDREWNTPIGRAQSTGGDSLVRTKAFRAVGGFADDQMAHEEPEFCFRLRNKGWEIARIDHRMTMHDSAMYDMIAFYRRCRRGGLGMAQAYLRHGKFVDCASRAIILRASVWSLGIPLLIAIALLIDWRSGLIVAAIYPLQWLRLTLRSWRSGEFDLSDSMKVSTLSFVGKFAETDGILRAIARFRGPRTADR